MKKKIITKSVIMLSVVTLLLSGCSREGKKHDSDSALAPEKKTYRNQLTDEELELDYIELELAETVKLAGTITPWSKYAEGLNMYYVEYTKPLTIDISTEEWDGLIIDKAQEIMRLIENESLGTFNSDKLVVYADYDKDFPITTINVPYTDLNGLEKDLWIELLLNDDKKVYVSTLTFCEDNVYGWGNLAEHIRRCTPDYSTSSLSFGGETAGDIFARTFIEELTGNSISEKRVCVPVDKERYEDMRNHYLGEYDGEAPREEYYYYYYYRQIDGFVSKRLWNAILSETLGDADTSLVEDADIHQITLEGSRPSEVCYGADGVKSIDIPVMWDVGEVYKENVAVASINEVIKNATQYFTEFYTSKRIEIKNIELCYGQNITDDNGEPLQKVWCPFWVVEYAVKPVYTTTCSVEYVIYDAFTGKRISIAPNLLEE